MTDKEIAIGLVSLIREQQSRITALETLLSRCRIDALPLGWKASIEEDLKIDLGPSSPFRHSVSQFEREVDLALDEQLLELARKEIFDPHG